MKKSFFRSPRIAFLLVLLTLFACVTINIYFPAEEVESVAEEIVDDVRGPQNQSSPGQENKPQSALIRSLYAALGDCVAWAQEATTVSNPTIRKLKEQMKARFQQIKPFFAKGNLIEKDDGFVALANADNLSLKERRNLTSLVEAENADRAELYKEVAVALEIDPSQVGRIGEVFAKEWKRSVP